MELDPNFLEFIELLTEHEAKFLVVGGYAVALHGQVFQEAKNATRGAFCDAI